MWGRINASLLRVAQGDSSYLMYKSVPLPVDLGSGDGEGRCKLGGGGGEKKGLYMWNPAENKTTDNQ